MKDNKYGIVKYDMKNSRRIIVRDNCSKDTFKKLAGRAKERFENFSYNSDNNTFVAGNSIYKYEWYPLLDFSNLN